MTAASASAPALNQEIVQKIQKLFTQLEKWRSQLTKVTEQFNLDDANLAKDLDAVLDGEPNPDAFVARTKARADKQAEAEGRKKAVNDALVLLRGRRDVLAETNKAEMIFVLRQILPQKQSDQEDIEELQDLYRKLTGKSYPTSGEAAAKAD